ncbi:MAG: DUF4147 domain-containing protein [Steroidobacteraceae bacterium]
MNLRTEILGGLDAALRSVDGRRVTAGFLRARDIRRTSVAAVGKAAAAMLQGAIDALGPSMRAALLVTKHAHTPDELRVDPRCQCLEAAHPLPDEASLVAGGALLEFIGRVPPGDDLLLLVSGGASSLVEVLREGVTLDQMIALTRDGLSSARDIAALNAERGRLSRLKAGGLTAAINRAALALFLSDVPGDDPAVIGSGLLAPRRGDEIERHVVARIDDALAAAALALQAEPSEIHIAPRALDHDTETAANGLMQALQRHRICIFGGESLVRLPPTPGRGGRNQHLGLILAGRIAGRNDVAILACGTDGTDGPTSDAGALVDGGTWSRIEDAGIDPLQSLALADSGTALAAAGDLVHTGPTGTNVGDLLIAMRRLM